MRSKRIHALYSLFLIVILVPAWCSAQEKVELKRSPHQIEVSIAGKPFGTYYFGPQSPKPYLSPLRSADGIILTRGWPMVKSIPGESHDHPHHNAVATVKGDPFVINGPGEYEVRGVFVTGVWSFADDTGGKHPYPPNNPAYPRSFIVKLTEVPTNSQSAGLTLATTEMVTDVIISDGSGNKSTDKFVNVPSTDATVMQMTHGGYNANHAAPGMSRDASTASYALSTPKCSQIAAQKSSRHSTDQRHSSS